MDAGSVASKSSGRFIWQAVVWMSESHEARMTLPGRALTHANASAARPPLISIDARRPVTVCRGSATPSSDFRIEAATQWSFRRTG